MEKFFWIADPNCHFWIVDHGSPIQILFWDRGSPIHFSWIADRGSPIQKYWIVPSKLDDKLYAPGSHDRLRLVVRLVEI